MIRPRRRLVLALVVAVIAVAAVAWSWRGGGEPRLVGYTTEAMSTTIELQLPEDDGHVGGERARDEAARDVARIFQLIDARMSEWKDTSPLGAVNRAAGEGPVAVPDDLRAVVRRGIEIGELTGGAFDITWAALGGLWDFRAAEPRVPGAAEVAERVALVDFTQIVVDDAAGTVELPRVGMKIGLGGIAKGYALDQAAAALRARGFESFLLRSGGQILVGGQRGPRPWRVGIRDPRGRPEDLLVTLSVTNTSVSTSGDYESYFELDGTRYHHILDPRAGMPSRGLRSATVVTPDATLADAFSTALMVLGRERALELVESLPGVEALLVDEGGQMHTSSGMGVLLE